MHAPAPRPRIALHRHTYPLRAIGMALGGIPVATVLYLQGAGAPSWIIVGFIALVWPHLARFLARNDGPDHRAEIRNLLIDSALAGVCASLMHFNLLPSAVLVMLACVDKISTGIRGLFRRSLPGLLLAALATAIFTGFAVDLHTPMSVVVACLPVLMVHTIAVSLATHRLIRTVVLKNLELDRLRRTDLLTGVSARSNWEEQAESVLHDARVSGRPACLLLIDVDEFKQINDRHGHAAGDAVLRMLGQTLRETLRAVDFAGRLGGDEFVALLPGATEREAAEIAERLRRAVQDRRIDSHPGLCVTISIGVSAVPAPDASLLAWFNDADRALYRAKQQGRNAVAAGNGANAGAALAVD